MNAFRKIVAQTRGLFEARGFVYSARLAEGLEEESNLRLKRAFAVRPASPDINAGASSFLFELPVVIMVAQQLNRTESDYDKAISTIADIQDTLTRPGTFPRSASVRGVRTPKEPEIAFHSETLIVHKFEIGHLCGTDWE